MIDREALAFSEATQALLQPILLASTDRIWIGLNDDIGDFFDIRMYGKDKNYPSSAAVGSWLDSCLLYTSPSPRDGLLSRMPSSA